LKLGSKHPTTGGFTLLEVLVAVAIIATAMVSLLALHGRNIQIVAYDQQLNRATLLAQVLLTRTLVADPFPDPTQSSGNFEADPDFQWQLQILPGATRDLEEQVREIRVRVFWDPADPDAVRLATLVRKPDQ
jgi:general secretion pathway protein I